MLKCVGRWSLVIVLLLSAQAFASDLCVSQDGGQTMLTFCGGEPFRTTNASVSEPRLVAVPPSSVLVILWNETAGGVGPIAYYAISLDGVEVKWVRKTSYDLALKYGSFDPLDGAPPVDSALAADKPSRQSAPAREPSSTSGFGRLEIQAVDRV